MQHRAPIASYNTFHHKTYYIVFVNDSDCSVSTSPQNPNSWDQKLFFVLFYIPNPLYDTCLTNTGLVGPLGQQPAPNPLWASHPRPSCAPDSIGAQSLLHPVPPHCPACHTQWWWWLFSSSFSPKALRAIPKLVSSLDDGGRQEATLFTKATDGY